MRLTPYQFHNGASTCADVPFILSLQPLSVFLFTTIKNVFIRLPFYLWLEDASTTCCFLYFFILFLSTLTQIIKSGSVISLEILGNKVRERIVFFLDARRDECLLLDTNLQFSTILSAILYFYFLFHFLQTTGKNHEREEIYRKIFWLSSWKYKKLSWFLYADGYMYGSGILQTLLSI